MAQPNIISKRARVICTIIAWAAFLFTLTVGYADKTYRYNFEHQQLTPLGHIVKPYADFLMSVTADGNWFLLLIAGAVVCYAIYSILIFAIAYATRRRQIQRESQH